MLTDIPIVIVYSQFNVQHQSKKLLHDAIMIEIENS